MVVRITLLSDGRADDPSTNSGVAYGLYDSIQKDERAVLAQTIDSRFGVVSKVCVRLLAFKPLPTWWKRSVGWGLAKPFVRSVKRSLLLRRSERAGQIAIHVRNFYFPSRFPYAPFLDTTLHLRQSFWPERELGRRHYWLLQLLERIYYRRASLIFTASTHVRDDLVSHYAISSDRIEVVGAGVADHDCTYDTCQRDYSTKPLRVLFAGKEPIRKGLDLLVTALESLQAEGVDVQLTVVGTDTLASEREFASRFLGEVSRQEMCAIYQENDVLCLPARFEPFGLVVLEAMAHGLPVVCSDVNALPELVDKCGAGIVFPLERTVQLQDALRALYVCPSLREQHGLAGQRCSTDLSWAGVVDKMILALQRRVKN